MEMLTAKAIEEQSGGWVVQRVDLPRLNKTAYLTALTLEKSEQLDQALRKLAAEGDQAGGMSAMVSTVVQCLCDAEGNLLFPDPIVGADVIKKLPLAELYLLFGEAMKLNNAEVTEEAIGEAVKKSEEIPVLAGSSESAESSAVLFPNSEGE